MLKPLTSNRNVTASFLTHEQQNMNLLNHALKDIELTQAEEKTLRWLCGWETSTIKNICSVLEKVKSK